MTTKREKTISKFQHTPQISERRRSLFPTEDSDSELGHMSPLSSYDSSSDSEEYHTVPKHSIGDYDILGIVENDIDPVGTPLSKITTCSDTMSPLHLSPFTHIHSTFIDETPSKLSPTRAQKTPHDTTTKNLNVPKLIRKSSLDDSCSLKRKSSLSSPESSHKIPNLDPKTSKVRTALFPSENDISISTKSFYSNSGDNSLEKILQRRRGPIVFSSGRQGSRPKKKTSQINNGVWHKIRKPKKKKISKKTIEKAVKLISNTNDALNTYIKDMNAMKNEPLKLIQENIVPIERKEPEKSQTEIKKTTPQPLLSIQENQEPDLSKKFFKHSRTRATVTVNKTMKLTVDNGKLAFSENKPSKPETNFDMTDLITEDDDQVLPKPNIDDILSSLTDDCSSGCLNDTTTSQIHLQAHSSVTASENSIQLHNQPMNVANMLLSPISQMCDVTSGLVLNSPKRSCNLTTILNEMPNASDILNDGKTREEKKLFPIFSGGKRSFERLCEDKENKTQPKKRFKGLCKDQMLLDAGQKKFGFTVCPECNLIYHMGDPGDEVMHQNYHSASHVLRFMGWKNERVVADFNQNGRIIKILPTDPKVWIKRVKDLMTVINRELGCYEMDFDITDSQVYLYVKNRTIAGCAVAMVPKSGAYKMLSDTTCSERSYPVKCGISRIWVSPNHRKQGVATALMNAVKNNFVFGAILSNSDVAVTPTTELGAVFAKKYFKTHEYFVYYT